MSTFFGLSIAKSGLFASQRSMEIAGHNIANAGTKGYSRQRLDQVASTPLSTAGGIGMLGTGVDMKSVTQIRDEFLDTKYRSENTTYGSWEYRYESLTFVESIFNEPSKNSITKSMDDFFNSIDELAKNADDKTIRAVVRQRTIAFTGTINDIANKLQNQIENTDFEVRATVNQVNTYAEDIARLNELIYKSEANGDSANDLRDKRNVLLDELSGLVDYELVKIEGDVEGDVKLNILVDGQPLVNHNQVQKLSTENEINHPAGLDDVKVREVTWENGSKVNVDALGGKLESQIGMRDNIDGDSKGIPYYIDKLNDFVMTLSFEMNKVHREGYGLDADATGINFFEANGTTFDMFTDEDYSTGTAKINDPNKVAQSLGVVTAPANLATQTIEGLMSEANAKGIDEAKVIAAWEDTHEGMTLYKDKETGKWMEVTKVDAKNISISDEIDRDLDNIAAATEYVVNEKGERVAKPGDGSNFKKMVDLRSDNTMFAWGNPDDFVKSLLSNLGVDTQEAKRMTANEQVLVLQVDNERQSISGVSIDEEMANVIKFQHAYNASARMITAVDEMIDVIVNRMGRVGL